VFLAEPLTFPLAGRAIPALRRAATVLMLPGARAALAGLATPTVAAVSACARRRRPRCFVGRHFVAGRGGSARGGVVQPMPVCLASKPCCRWRRWRKFVEAASARDARVATALRRRRHRRRRRRHSRRQGRSRGADASMRRLHSAKGGGPLSPVAGLPVGLVD
jgi:hypothetical protein